MFNTRRQRLMLGIGFICLAVFSIQVFSFSASSTFCTQDIARRAKSLVFPTEIKLIDGSIVRLPDNFDPRRPLKVALIALDKDDTLTKAREPISDESADRVIALLEKGVEEGTKILVLTGSDAANAMQCVSDPIRQRILDSGKDISIMQNLIISASVGGFNLTFDQNGDFKKLHSSPIFDVKDRAVIWGGIMHGFSAALDKYKAELGISAADMEGLNAEIGKVESSQADDLSRIEMFNQAFLGFISKYPEVFGDAAGPREERIDIRDEDVYEYAAPKITFEVAHLPAKSEPIMRRKEFTDIVKAVAMEHIAGVEGLNPKNGPTYVDFARSKTKSEIMLGMMADPELGIDDDGAVVVGGDSSNDADLMTVDLPNRVVFRYYVGLEAKFGEYLKGMPADKVAQVVHCSTAGPSEISLLFAHILETLGKPMGNFPFINNRVSYYDALGKIMSLPLCEPTAETFKEYGWVVEPTVDGRDEGANYFSIVTSQPEREGSRVATLVVGEQEITKLERHSQTYEYFGVLKGRCVLFLAEPGDNPNLDTVKAFVLEPGKPLLLKKGVWHGIASLEDESVVVIFESSDVTSEYFDLGAVMGI